MKIDPVCGKRGLTLVEVSIALVLFALIFVSLLLIITRNTSLLAKARVKYRSERVNQSAIALLKNIDFYAIVSSSTTVAGSSDTYRVADSDMINFGFSGTFNGSSTYPYLGVFQKIDGMVKEANGTRFRVLVRYMRRDRGDSNNNGLTSDLVPFVDRGDGTDVSDTALQFVQRMSDADFNDTGIDGSTGELASEVPNTNIKEITIEIWKKTALLSRQSFLLDQGQLSGQGVTSSESTLTLQITTPSFSSTIFKADNVANPGQTAARALSITKSYPANPPAFRGDSLSPLIVGGETVPGASVNFYGPSAALLTTMIADGSGVFSAASAAITASLTEGTNNIMALATKSSFLSPATRATVVVDVAPPQISGQTPNSPNVGSRAPFVGAVIKDLPIGLASTTVSGVCADVITLKANGAVVAHLFDPETGRVQWTSAPGVRTPPTLNNGGTYAMELEGGDWARYKVKRTWNFTIAVPASDITAPIVDAWSPTGTITINTPEIAVRLTDVESGIDPATIVMKIDNAAVPAVYDVYDGFVRYLPANALADGTHTVSVTAGHWAASPTDKIVVNDQNQFSIAP